MSYFVVMFGDTVHGYLAYGISHWSEPDNVDKVSIVATMVVSIVGCIIGAIFWLVSLTMAIDEDDEAYKPLLVGFPAVLYFFSFIAGPIDTFGPNPFRWASPWTFLLVAAFMPVALVIKDLVFEIRDDYRYAKEKKDKEPPDNVRKIG